MLLSKTQLSVLRILYDSPGLTFNEIKTQLPEADPLKPVLKNLLNSGLIAIRTVNGLTTRNYIAQTDKLELTELGKAELENYSDSERKFRKNTRLAVAALIISAISAGGEALHWLLT